MQLRKQYALSLHKRQMEVYRSGHRFRVVVAGRRWGKTALARVSIIKYARIKNRLIWYVAPSYRMAKQIMWPELLEAIPKRWIKKINDTTLTITLINRTRIELKGADNPDSLRGVGIHFLVMDEVQDIDPKAWDTVLRPTLSSTGGHVLFIGTPKSYNFLFDLFTKGQNPISQKIGLWQSWQFPTSSSPFIPAEEIESAKADMDIRTYNQEYNASFETMSGRVYFAFDRKIHVGKYEFNPKLPIWVGQDFNVDPMFSVILQPQHSGEVWAVAEIVRNGSNTEETCDELDRLYWQVKENVTIYPDPASNQRQHARGETDLDIFIEKGFKKLKHRRQHPPVVDRVNCVNRMFKAADNSIRMRVSARCKELIRGLEQTIYKEGEREVDKSMSVEHGPDALGYPIEFEFPMRKFTPAGLSI